MNAKYKEVATIEKELLESMRFPNEDVLFDMEKIKQREYNAQRAAILGNSFNDKVNIVFEDTEGMKIVEVTIWGLIDKYVLLKRGLKIPIHCIHEILI